MKGERGFTLVEMLVALSIFAVIAAMGVSLLRSSVDTQDAVQTRLEQGHGAEPRLQELGLQVAGESLLPAELEVLGPRRARLTLHEGRYHQVRRMFAAVGNHVEALHRERIGGLALDGLVEGEWRLLDEEDRALLFG